MRTEPSMFVCTSIQHSDRVVEIVRTEVRGDAMRKLANLASFNHDDLAWFRRPITATLVSR